MCTNYMQPSLSRLVEMGRRNWEKGQKRNRAREKEVVKLEGHL